MSLSISVNSKRQTTRKFEFDTRPEHQGKTLQNGNFWLYVTDGIANPNVQPPNPSADVESSDFCVYEESTGIWHVVKREGSGIQSLSATPHGIAEEYDSLEIDDTDPQNLKIKTTNYLVSRPETVAVP